MNNDVGLRSVLGFIILTLAVMEFYYLALMSRATKAGVSVIKDNRLSASLPASLIDIGLILTLIYVLQPQWMAWSRLALPAWLRWSGVSLALAGLLLRFWAHLALGHNYAWYMRVHGTQQLVTHGPYSRVRHPMYTAALLLTIGLSLGATSWLIGVLLLVPAVVTLVWRLEREEAMLLEKFGDAYRTYQQHTGRLLPRW